MVTAEIAMHLWAGYTEEGGDSAISNVAYVAQFVPAVEAVSQELSDRMGKGEMGWGGVFAYDVVQAAGAWLYRNAGRTNNEDFCFELRRLCK
jgi:methyl coenzyme M reductase alpha subunit